VRTRAQVHELGQLYSANSSVSARRQMHLVGGEGSGWSRGGREGEVGEHVQKPRKKQGKLRDIPDQP